MTLSSYDLNTDILRFNKLIRDLESTLEPDDTLDFCSIDIKRLTNLMEDYCSQEDGWQRYAHANCSSSYTRNLVEVGNDRYNLVSLRFHQGWCICYCLPN